MIIEKEYKHIFNNIRKCAKKSIALSIKDPKYLPGIKYLEDHFLFDLPIYRNLRIIRFVSKNIPERSEVLDWGCGYGDASFMLKSLRPDLDVISYDIFSSSPWEVLAGKESLKKVVSDNENNVPFETERFDVILGIGVLEHVENQKNSLEEIYRILKPGGKFYIFLYPNKLSYTERFQKTIGNPHHDKPMKMKNIISLLSQSNFFIEDSEYQLMMPFVLSRFPKKIRRFYNLFGNIIVVLNEILEKIPVLNRLSSNFMLVCIKK